MSAIENIGKVPKLIAINETVTNPVQNIYETVLTLTNVQLGGLSIKATAGAETVNVKITIDGVVFSGIGVAIDSAGNHSTGVNGAVSVNDTANYLEQQAAGTSYYTSSDVVTRLKGKSITVEFRKTTAAGASTFKITGWYYQF